MRRRSNPPAKRYFSYTVEEIARLRGVHKNTVRNWLRSGLAPIDDRRPIMVKGSVLNAFLSMRRAQAKRPCAPGELYCLPCGKPQRPAGDMAEYVALTATTGSIRAICPGCDRLIFQRVNAARLAVFQTLLDVTSVKA
jgi:hypothetical protein